MDTSLEHGHAAHEHGLEPHVLVARARAGVLMLVISDALSVLAILAGGGYLSALNTENQFHVAGDFAPAFTPGLVIMIGLVLSGLAYWLWARGASKSGKGATPVFLLSVVLMLAAGVAETWLGAALKYGGSNGSVTIDAYQSVQLLIVWYTAVHLLLSAAIGILLFGRVLSGRLAGRSFVAEVTGYWWYYTVISALALWVFGVLLK